MARLRPDFQQGTITDNPLLIGATTANSAEFANLPVVASPDILAVTIDPLKINGAPEIVWITAHTSAATSATILRAQEGSTARAHTLAERWVVGPTAFDFYGGGGTLYGPQTLASSATGSSTETMIGISGQTADLVQWKDPTNTTLLASITAAGEVYSPGSAVGSLAFRTRVTADTNDRFTLQADGTLNWGPGNAVTNTNLYMSAGNTLKTDDTFIAGTGLQVLAGNFQVDAQGRVGLGGGLNTAALLEVGLGNAHPSAAVSVMGIETDFTAPATATSGVYGHHIRIRTAASAFTVATAYQIQVDSPIFGASSAVTTVYGVRIENQGAANVTNAYGLWLATQSGAATTNVPLVIGSASTFSIDSTGRVYFGVSAASGAANGAMLQVMDTQNHAAATTSVRGLLVRYTAPSTATAESAGVWWQPRTAAAAFTVSDVYGFIATTPSLGAGSAITRLYGAKIQNQGASGVGNAYGLWIDAQSGASSNNLPLVVGGTATWSVTSQGTMGVGNTASTAVMVDVLGSNAHPGTATSLYGVGSQPAWPATTTSTAQAFYGRTWTAASAFTLGSSYVYRAEAPVVGAGSAITNQYGMFVHNQGASGVTNAYGLWIDAVSGAATNNLPLVVGNTSTWAVDSQGRMGVGASLQVNTLVNVSENDAHPGAGTSVWGVAADYISPATSTTASTQFYGKARTAAAAFTQVDSRVFHADTPTVGAASAITNLYGLRVENQGVSGITNAYGVWIAAQSGAATNNLPLVVGGTSTWSVDSQGRMGINSAKADTRMIYLGNNNHPNASVSIYGIHTETQIPSTATTLFAAYTSTIRTSAAAFTLASAYGFQAEPPAPLGAGSAITSIYGFIAGSQGRAGITNAYGFYGSATSGAATLNVTARFDSGTTAALWLGGDGTSTSVSGGIAFGSGRDVTVYRSAASTLGIMANFAVDSLGRMSLGTGAAPVTDRYFDVGGGTNHPSAATTVRGFVINYSAPSTATVESDIFYAQIRTAAAAFTLATAYAYLVDTPTIGASSAVTTAVGFRALNQGNAGATNAYGAWIAAQSSAATLNVGARIDTSTTAALWLGGDAAGTTVAGGIAFGSGRDVSLYRQAGSVLETGGTFSAVTGFQVNHAAAGAGTYLRGDGTKFVGASIAAGDLPSSGIANVAYLNLANTFTVGGQQITNNAVGTTNLILQGIQSQTADYLQARNYAGIATAGIDNDGTLYNYGTGMSLNNLAVPSGVTVTPQGAAGATTYGYRVAALKGSGLITNASATVQTTTGNAALSVSNFNRVSWTAVPGAAQYKIYGRTSGSELLMATISAATTTWDDTGAVTPSGALPGNPAGTTVVVKAWQNQTGDMQQWLDSTGAVQASITAGTGLQVLVGNFQVDSAGAVTAGTSIFGSTSLGRTGSVNYVQFTGAASLGVPLIQAASSLDANVNFDIASKGIGSLRLNVFNGGGTGGFVSGDGAGNTKFSVDSAGRMGTLGTAVNAAVAVNINATHPGSGTSLWGVIVQPTFPSTTTVAATSIYGQVKSAAVLFTLTTANVFQADAPVRGANSTITTLNGLRVENQGNAGVTNAFGIDVAAQSGSPTLNIGARLSGGTQANLWLNSDTASAAGGIALGTARDVSLYRGGSGILNLNGLMTVDTSGRLILNNTTPNTAIMLSLGGVSAAHPGNATTLFGYHGNFVFPSTTTVGATVYYGLVQSAAAAFTIATSAVYRADTPVLGAGSTLTDQRGLWVNNQGAAGVTNAYGVFVQAISGASTLNVAASLGGGTQANLWLNSDTASAAGGMTFGTARDTNLYRSAAGILTGPTVLDVSTGYRIGGAAASGQYLRGNGTNFVSAAIAVGDLPSTIVFDADYTAKGVVLVGTGVGTYSALTVGANNTVLMADSTQTTGTRWGSVAVIETVSNPVALGTAAPGAGVTASAFNHIHPTTGLALLAGGNTFSGAQTFGGSTQIDANGLLGVRGTPAGTALVDLLGTHPSAATTVYGVNAHTTFPSTATTEINALRTQVSTAAAAYTVATAVALRVASTSLGAGSAITNNYGIWVEPRTVGTNDYGVRVDTAQTQTLWLAGDDASATTAAKGIAFGSARDVSIFRGGSAWLNIGGNYTVDTNGHVNLGSAGPATDRYLNIAATHSGGNTAIYGGVFAMTAPSTATVSYQGIFSSITTVASAFTLAQADGFYGAGVAVALGAGSAITTHTGFRAANYGAAGVTNAYGVFVAAQSGAGTLNVAASLGGGTQANLWLNNDTATAAGGIAFGTARDVSLYRQATLVLECSGTVSAVTGFQVNHTAATAGTYLRGDGVRFVQANIAAGDLPTSGIPNVAYRNAANTFTTGAQTIQGSLVVSGGNWQVDSSGRVAGGGSAPSAAVLQSWGAVAHPGAATSLWGSLYQPIFPSTTTVLGVVSDVQVRTAAAAFTLAEGIGYRVSAPSLGAASAITNQHGLQIKNQGVSGVTNAYGIAVEAQSGASGYNVACRLDGGIYNLWLNSNTAGVGGGIGFGNVGGFADVALYRGAAGVLQTDAEFRAPNLDAMRWMAVGP